MKSVFVPGITILLVLIGSSVGRPSGEERDEATTTPESIETIFRKYDQQYPFHGGTVPGDEAEVQNDAPVMDAIIERLNEIINDERPSEFTAPSIDATPKQRSLLRQQNEELSFGSLHLNRRVTVAPVHRVNPEKTGALNLDQNVFFNKDLLADSYNNRPATPRLPIRIPVRMPTRFPTRRPNPTTSTTTPAVPSVEEEETISDIIAEELQTRPEGNKLSIPVLSVATEDFEEDIHPPARPAHPVKPNRVSAQTEDFEDRHLHRERRESDSGTYAWFMNKMSYWFNFYGEVEDEAGAGRKMSALSKRQLTNDTEKEPASEIPIAEQVKSVDVPPQVADEVIETILDIDDKQTRNEFAKDVPAIEDKLEELEEQAEANKSVEVSIVKLGDTEPEELGIVIEDLVVTTTRIDDSEMVIEDVRPEIDSLLPTEVTPEVNLTVLGRGDVEIAEAARETANEALHVDPLASQTGSVVSEPEIPQPAQPTDDEIMEFSRSIQIPSNSTEIAPAQNQPAPLEPEATSTNAAETPAIVVDLLSNEFVENPQETPAPESHNQDSTRTIVDTSLAADQLDLSRADVVAPETKIISDAEPSLSPVTEDNVTTLPTTINREELEFPQTIDTNPERITTAWPILEPILEDIPAAIPTPAVRLDPHTVEEAVLITDSVDVTSKKPAEDPAVPIIISEEGFEAQSAIGTKEDTPVSSGSESQSISTTESTFNSSEEEDDAEKLKRKEEKRLRKEEKERLKQEEKRLKKEEKDRRKAAGLGSSEEELGEKHQHISLTAQFVEPQEKLTKEEMVNMLSSPEDPVESRRFEKELVRSDPAVVITEVTEAEKNVSVNHVVIKKDGVATPAQDDNSAESEEEGAVTVAPDAIQTLNEVLDKEMAIVQEVLSEIQSVIDEEQQRITETTEAATETTATEVVGGDSIPMDPQTADTAELTNSIISSKNTRHLAVGYMERDALLGSTDAEEESSSRAFILVGSGLFLITGFVLFSLVVMLVRRSGRQGSLDLTIEP